MANLLLRLVVRDKSVFWELNRCDLEGKRTLVQSSIHDGEPLEQDRRQLEQRVKTITLLADLQQLVADMRRSAKWDADVIEGIALRVVERLGEQLYEFLFPGNLARILNSAINETVNGLLRIELEFQGDAVKLYGRWPWEYLRSPAEEGIKGSGQFLALRAQLVLNRRLHLNEEAGGIRTGKPKVLLIVAGPPGKALGSFGVVEASKVVQTLHDLRNDNVIDLVELVEPKVEFGPAWQPTATWDAFRRKIQQQQPEVIHFIGHGQRVYDAAEKSEHSELVFVGEGCTPDPRRDTDFVQVVSSVPNLKLVFLQACESGVPGPHASATSVGQLLAHNGIPAVVAMQAKVENIVANDFAEAFYTALREHKPVDWAVRAGREAIQNVSPALKLAFGVPVLFLRSYEALIGHAAATTTPSTGGGGGAPRGSAADDEAARLAVCPRCGSTDLDKVCADCGLRVVCSNAACGKPLRLDPNGSRANPMKRFCKECGTEHLQPAWTPPATFDPTGAPRPKLDTAASAAPAPVPASASSANVADLLSTVRQSGRG
jgi:hypothetical protein